MCLLCLLQKSLGQCKAIAAAAPNLPEGFCQKTCGRCTTSSGPTSSSSTSSPSTTNSDSPQTSPSPSQTTSSPPQATSSTSSSQTVTAAVIGSSDSTPARCTCTDTQPDSKYTCTQQKAFGQCSQSFVLGQGHCQTTCGQCKCNPSCKCDDVQPPGSFTCAQQVNRWTWSQCILPCWPALQNMLCLESFEQSRDSKHIPICHNSQ